jgi:hypothetical protein
VAAVWRDTLIAFCSHAPGILVFASIGFAGASLLGLGASLAFNLHRYVHASGSFATYSGIYETFAVDPRLFVVLVVQSLIGWLLASFARGAITHVALHEASFGQACVCAFSRLPALLAGTLIYSALIGFGAVGVNVWLRDRDATLDLSHVGQKPEPVTLEGALHVTFLRSWDALLPNPGSPVTEFVPRLRHTAFRQPQPAADHHQKLVVESNNAINGIRPLRTAETPALPAELQRVVIAGLLALTAGETVLRLRSVAAIRSAGMLAPLLLSVAWGVRHFVPITIHVWLVRFAVLLFNIVFIIVPVVVVQCIADPPPAWTGLPSPVVSLPTIVFTITLINSGFGAFCAVYDVQLYRALTGESAGLHPALR